MTHYTAVSSSSQLDAEDLQILSYLTVEDLQTDIRKLEDQIEIAKDELADLEEERPYRPEGMAKLRRGYHDSLGEMHSQIAKTYELLQAKEALCSCS